METLDLSTFFITKAQATDFSARLSSVIEKVYTNTFDLEKTLGEYLGLQKKDLILKLFTENHISVTVPTEVQGFLKKLQETIATLPVVTLTIPFEPTDETLKSFSDWFIFTLKKHVLFALEIDKSLLAGARITYNGKLKDYTLRTKFLTIMESLTQTKPQSAATTMSPQPVPPTSTQHTNPTTIPKA